MSNHLTIEECEEIIANGEQVGLPRQAFFVQLLETMKRERELWGCLKELVLLKEHKDKCGKTIWYEEKQPKAWDNARKALEARCEYPVVSEK